MAGDKKVKFMGIAKMNAEDLAFMAEQMSSGKVKPVVEKTYALADAGLALKYIGPKHTKGKVVISV